MKVEKVKTKFKPVVITIENEFELSNFVGLIRWAQDSLCQQPNCALKNERLRYAHKLVDMLDIEEVENER